MLCKGILDIEFPGKKHECTHLQLGSVEVRFLEGSCYVLFTLTIMGPNHSETTRTFMNFLIFHNINALSSHHILTLNYFSFNKICIFYFLGQKLFTHSLLLNIHYVS